jgi:HAE1 family hydrophobic/amphiphilic exporter-1
VGAFFIKRPIFAIVLSIVIVIVGLVSMGKLPIAQFPNIVPPVVKVTAGYQGADALTIEQSVATPLEQKLNGVDNALYIRSTNANDGSMAVEVTFEVGTDIDMDNVLTQNRVNEGSSALPAEVKASGITVKKSLGMPMMVVSMYSPNESYDADFIGNFATINVVDTLSRIPGVGQVNLFGSADYAMRVWVKPDRLARLGLTVGDLRAAVQRQNSVNPAGQIGGEPAPKGQEFTYAVRAQGRLVTAEEFGDVVVREDSDGSVVRLKDVARIELGTAAYLQRARYNGKPATLITVYQSPGSNALAVSKAVRDTMQEQSSRFPKDLAYAVSLDTTLAVQAGIDEIVDTLFEAVILVILVVFLFLQNIRATLIPLLTVPVSLIGAFALFPLLGFSINTLSLLGLVLAIGLVVDDAIVVVEAVEHHIEKGLSPVEATKKAMAEVSGPVVAIAIVLSAVFVPVAFLGGITGQLYKQFALTIAISVMISAFNALTLSPALCALLLRPRKKSNSLVARAFGAFNRGFDRATNAYVGVTKQLVRKLAIATAILVAIVGGVAVLGKRLPGGFVPNEDQGYFFVNVQLPPAASLQRTDEVCKKVEDILRATEGVRGVDTVAGYSLLSSTSGSYAGFFFVELEPWEERRAPGRDIESILAKVNREAGALPEAQVVAFPPPAIPGIGSSGGFSLQLQDRVGGTPEELEAMAGKFVAAASKRPEIGSVFTLFSAKVPQVFVKVDRDKMMKLGVEPSELYGTLQAFMGSSYLNDFNRFGRQWRVFLSAEPEYRRRVEEMGNFFVRSKTGTMVPLSALTEAKTTNGPDYTVRFNLARAAEISGAPAPGYSSAQAMDALEQVAKEVLPAEYGYAWSNLSFQERKAPASGPTFALAILFVFLILAAQYESWALPFSVLLVVPAAVLGAFAGLLATRLPFDVFGQIGLVMLVGLSAKNAILIVEFAKEQHESGKPLIEATLSAAGMRLRPILMTAFAFILGCVPLLRATGAGAASRHSMGAVVVFGSLAATFLGIFLTPALFVLVESLVARFRKHGGGEASGPDSPRPPVASNGTESSAHGAEEPA